MLNTGLKEVKIPEKWAALRYKFFKKLVVHESIKLFWCGGA
jgi:hypothetical protein